MGTIAEIILACRIDGRTFRKMPTWLAKKWHETLTIRYMLGRYKQDDPT